MNDSYWKRSRYKLDEMVKDPAYRKIALTEYADDLGWCEAELTQFFRESRDSDEVQEFIQSQDPNVSEILNKAHKAKYLTEHEVNHLDAMYRKFIKYLDRAAEERIVNVSTKHNKLATTSIDISTSKVSPKIEYVQSQNSTMPNYWVPPSARKSVETHEYADITWTL